MTDGAGTTSYTYYPPGVLGAGSIQTVDGPLDNDTITYGYDELGRVNSKQIGGPSRVETQAFDALGRLTQLTNPLGNFTYAYDGVTGRPLSVTYPNSQQTTYAYFDSLGDHRLQEIHNKKPGGATLSKFDYTYNAVGNILTWQQQTASNPAQVYQYGYDGADQLTAAILMSADPTPVVLRRYYYAYDAAANRTAEQIDDAVTASTYNNMNQLVSQAAGGALIFKGTVSEPATVTVAGRPATVTADNRFAGAAVVPGGTGQVVVTATDYASPTRNTRTNTYQVSQSGTPKSFTFDANGNMTSDGTKTYAWDAENRLVAVLQGATTLAGLAYNSGGIRTRKMVGGVTTTYVLEGVNVVEERSSAGGATKHFQGPGIDNVLAAIDPSGVTSYYVRDHLGSIRQRTDTSGNALLTRDYDAWGNPLAGASTAGWSFTGREWDPETSLYYYRARYHAPSLGRFISEDPIGLRGGPNYYTYVEASPVSGVDPSGTTCMTNTGFLLGWLAGALPCEMDYAESSTESQEMTGSPGAEMLRRAFKANNCQPLPRFEFTTPDAAQQTLPNPCSTAAQVGGFMGSASPVGGCKASYTIRNEAGTNSFYYHILPDLPPWLPAYCFIPQHTVTQTFTWTEASPCKSECKCGNQ
jgi:RHS repeat-associated protein